MCLEAQGGDFYNSVAQIFIAATLPIVFRGCNNILIHALRR
jgi:hypothetical protein